MTVTMNNYGETLVEIGRGVMVLLYRIALIHLRNCEIQVIGPDIPNVKFSTAEAAKLRFLELIEILKQPRTMVQYSERTWISVYDVSKCYIDDRTYKFFGKTMGKAYATICVCISDTWSIPYSSYKEAEDGLNTFMQKVRGIKGSNLL